MVHFSAPSWLLLLSLLVAASASAQVTDDAFDLAQGAVVIDCGGGNCENVIGGMLGSAEQGNYICPTGAGIGAFCWLEFETPAAVAITGIHFLANHDRDGTTRRATDLFELFADLTGDLDFDDPGEDLISKSIAIPYLDEPDNAEPGPDGNQLDLSFDVRATATRWRVQVRYAAGVTGAGSDGPRIREVDALTDPVSCLDLLSLRTGLLAAKDGSGGVRFQWDADSEAPVYHLNALDSVALLGPLAHHRAPVGSAFAVCDAAAPSTSCTHVDADSAGPLLFYQVVSACGGGGLEEGPLD